MTVCRTQHWKQTSCAATEGRDGVRLILLILRNRDSRAVDVAGPAAAAVCQECSGRYAVRPYLPFGRDWSLDAAALQE